MKALGVGIKPATMPSHNAPVECTLLVGGGNAPD